MPDKEKTRILIVGGVAGGASCAARARRLSEEAEIIIFERGKFVSFASCGLPYYVGEVIVEEKELLVANPHLFKSRFNIEVRLLHEVLYIEPTQNKIKVKNLESGQVYEESYSALVLATGTKPVVPSLAGLELPGVFNLRTIADSNNIKSWIKDKKVKRAAIIGGGFIGMEACENLVKLGIQVSIFEILPQVMPPLDPEMAKILQECLSKHDVDVHLSDGITSLSSNGNALQLKTHSGIDMPVDMVLLATGVKPDISLAQRAGLEIGQLGGIRVDCKLHTSDARIWAVGDVVETDNFVTGEKSLTALAGPASRMGRIAADVITGREAQFRGVQASLICQVFETTAASTGATEKALARSAKQGRPITNEKVYLHPTNHAVYYPGSQAMTIKLIFSPVDGKILGAQAVGGEGVDKRIDVIAMAIQKGASVFELEEAELCYAPQFGSAKDPVNLAGMVAANVLRGDSPLMHWEQAYKQASFVLDVRDPLEYAGGHVEGAVNIPLSTLRAHVNELPIDREIVVYCAAGQRSYYATRMLKMKGFKVRNISGGFSSYPGNNLAAAGEGKRLIDIR
jgi:NADPH-dependent 2,4-dienoyl-CoA reductase/sulfur reductase-like enzyme/rhodanese-related sulfurtransferase